MTKTMTTGPPDCCAAASDVEGTDSDGSTSQQPCHGRENRRVIHNAGTMLSALQC